MPIDFRHVVVDGDPPGSHHDITLLHDLTGNGLPDIVAPGKDGLYVFYNEGFE